MADIGTNTRDGAPAIGWRVWHVREDRLHSWAVKATWSPGDNSAECLDAVPCSDVPGRRCQCGFWALWTARQCLDRFQADTGVVRVLGLVSGWGSIAIHGREGFRGQYAAVRCLFTDPWAARGPRPLAAWIMTKMGHRKAPDDDASRQEILHRVAEAYGVPLLSVVDADRYGLLSEFGAHTEAHPPAGWRQT